MLKQATLAVGIGLCMLPQHLLAEVYKWIDEAGITHYSATPPPKQSSQPGNVENLGKLQSGKSKNHYSTRLSGTWWGLHPDRKTTLEYDFGYRGFEFREYRYLHSSPRIVGKSEGEYNLNGLILELFYVSNNNADGLPSKSKKTMELVEATGSTFSLIFDGKSEIVFRREDFANNSMLARDLKGVWQHTKDDTRLIQFNSGRFAFLEKRGEARKHKVVALGSWEWLDPEIELDFLADYKKPVNHKYGKRLANWYLQSKDGANLVFLDTKTKKRINLKRIR